MFPKLFPLDKNYILRQAQATVQENLIGIMVEELRKSYTRMYNPLGLMDDTYLEIMTNLDYPKDAIKIIYKQLAGIYRYKFGSNQLELLFDGKSHLEKYQEEWSDQLVKWIKEMGLCESYVKTMLRMTLLNNSETKAVFAENHCKSYINGFFQVKIIKRNGELKLRTA